jgi:hypothetical protein
MPVTFNNANLGENVILSDSEGSDFQNFLKNSDSSPARGGIRMTEKYVI